MSAGRPDPRNGIPSPAAAPGSDRPEPPTADGSFRSARSRPGCNPATAAVSSYADADSPARGLTFSAMTPNAAKRRRFRSKRDEVEIFLAASTEDGVGFGGGSVRRAAISSSKRSASARSSRLISALANSQPARLLFERLPQTINGFVALSDGRLDHARRCAVSRRPRRWHATDRSAPARRAGPPKLHRVRGTGESA